MSIPRIPEGKGWIDQLLQHCDGSKAVQVYKNLHKDCWSVRQSGKVVAHMDYICLKHCSFKVSEKGRDRVRKEGSKSLLAASTTLAAFDIALIVFLIIITTPLHCQTIHSYPNPPSEKQ